MSLARLLAGQVEVRVAAMVERQFTRSEILRVLFRDFPSPDYSAGDIEAIYERGLTAWSAAQYVERPPPVQQPPDLLPNPSLGVPWQATVWLRFELPGTGEEVWKTAQIQSGAPLTLSDLEARARDWVGAAAGLRERSPQEDRELPLATMEVTVVAVQIGS